MRTTAIMIMEGKAMNRAMVIAERIQDPFMTGVITARIAELKKRMMTSVVCFEYLKKDGTVTRRWGTTSASLAMATTTGTGMSGDNRNVVCYFDVTKGAWRSFQIQSLIRIID